jgi:PPM family protein phosphatase
MTGEVAQRCAACEAPVLADDRFCEACGAAIGAIAADLGNPCGACGAPPGAVDADGYCTVCGVRETRERERTELDLAVAAAVSEQGRTHRRNEDAFHVERVDGGGVVAVVCDGISTAASGDAAARAAAAAAGAVLARALRDGTASEDGTLQAAAADAARAARDAVRTVPWTMRSDLALPSCTLVCAACRPGEVVVGWVGDSRAYWLTGDEGRQLTVDHSWASEQVRDGLLEPDEAAADHRAHAITRWIGDDAPSDALQVTAFRPNGRGRLVLCSDGLWNYAPAAGDLAEILDGMGQDAPPADVARRLADAAMARGGRDDVTVAVIDIDDEEGGRP